MLKLLNITVIRFTHEGMPVNSMLVPEVEATAVPETRGYTLPVTPSTSKSGEVIPLVPSIVTAI